MKSGKFMKITDDMIGMDDKICSCAAKVVDTIISHGKKKKTSLRKITESLRKGQKIPFDRKTKK